MKRKLNYNLSGTEVYNTNALILLVKKMLHGEHHRQKSFNLVLFSYEIGRAPSPIVTGPHGSSAWCSLVAWDAGSVHRKEMIGRIKNKIEVKSF